MRITNNNDNWRSNQVFIIGGSQQGADGHWTSYCNKFNFRKNLMSKCDIDIATNVPGDTPPTGVYGYIENEYRYYLFGGQTYGIESDLIQYLVLDYNYTTE